MLAVMTSVLFLIAPYAAMVGSEQPSSEAPYFAAEALDSSVFSMDSAAEYLQERAGETPLCYFPCYFVARSICGSKALCVVSKVFSETLPVMKEKSR